ncbi:HTH-type transcriptional regulator DmlR [Paraburkholderia aspalathi]|uniref:LysR family transcriptional regulator n=1 Tax=Paraburkholderia aspalathi TaxID=1324617 RepID=UPI001B2AACEF|nr:LysR family transcriptional regulator [Paraburkholderia aspalathi]CAE6870604.1 HTH-type transcriptional regulator DmlR [Paraburkholderia aspalathi]
MDRLTEIELFVRAAELGSLSKAAEKLDMSLSAASRHLISLEARLGARLIERSTRRVYLTEIGQEHFERCKHILADIQESESLVGAVASNPSGVLRVSSTVSFCMNHIGPLLPRYVERYPGVRVDVEASNRYYTLLGDDIDLAVRTREYEPDSNITIRRLAETRRVLAASPEYLSSHGTPRSPEDLLEHRLLLYSYANRPDELRLSRNGNTTVLPVSAAMKSNEGQVIRAAALRGHGILVQPKYVIYDDLVSGRLIPVLDDWDLPRLVINLAYPFRKFVPAKVRTFIDFLVEEFRDADYERKWTA